MQDPGPFLRGSHKGSYGTLGRARPASAAAQGLADLGGPRRADGRRDGRPPPPGPGTIGLCRLRCRRAARAPGFKRNLFAPPPAPSSRQRGGISRPGWGGSLSRSTDYRSIRALRRRDGAHGADRVIAWVLQ